MKKIMAGFLISLFLSTAAHAGAIAVIANNSFSKSALTASQVKDIYLGKMEIVEGTKIQPIDHKDSEAIKKDFLGKTLNFSVSDYKGYWVKKVFKDGGSPPSVKGSADDVIKAVKEDKGSIGYVWEEDAKNIAGVKILLKISD